MYEDAEVKKLIRKLKKKIEKELTKLFSSVGLDVSEYIDKMYVVCINDEGDLIVDLTVPYADVIELGMTDDDNISLSVIVDWYLEYVKDDLDEATEFAKKYLKALNKCKGLHLNRKLGRIVMSYLFG